MDILLANPRGFCAGVDRAIDIVERAIELFGAPIYVRHEVVHNRHVVDRLRGLGARFVEELDEVPQGATVIFSAHGVSSRVEEEARRRELAVFDATCPLVTKVHMEVARYARDALDVVLIGHSGHPEVEGTMGRFDASLGGRIMLVESVADVRRLERCDVLVVVGSRTSSNSNRLRELADRRGVPGYLIDGPDDLKREWLAGKRAIGVTAGASAPELLVEQVVERLRSWGGEAPTEAIGREEKVFFTLPRELRRADDITRR
jgi:4-hydroxy-3-methylbut-2-enyl diphosphate reductase